MCNVQCPCDGEKKVSKRIHKGKCATYSTRENVRKKICNIPSICVLVWVGKRKSAKDKIRRKEKWRGREKISRIRFKGIPNPMSVSFHPCCCSGKRTEKRGVRLIKICIARLQIPRDAYRCVFVFLIGNVSHGEAYNISTYSGNIDISLLIVRVSDTDISVVTLPKIIDFIRIKWNCYTIIQRINYEIIIHAFQIL